MNHPLQEDLLGYLLGALDAQEQRDLQQKIDNDPSLEEALLELKSALVPLDCLENQGSRPGLARRTCEAVANWENRSAEERLAFLDKPPLNEPPHVAGDAPEFTPNTQSVNADSQSTNAGVFTDSPAALGDLQPADSKPKTSFRGPSAFGRSTWSMRDMLVGVASLAILAGLLLPALSISRHNSRLLACQDNLRQVGMAFKNYSSIHDGGFVAIPQNGNLAVSGCYGPLLKNAGLLEDDSLLACAGLGSGTAPVIIPSVEQIEAAQNEAERVHYRRTMGGHFGYSMGYKDGNQYRAPRDGSAQLILLADRPSTAGDRQSQNHGGRGQNCLFADGRVEFVSGPAYGTDLVYENDYGIVGPGSNMLDSVIAPSHLAPAF